MQLTWLDKMHALGSDSYHGKIKKAVDAFNPVAEGEAVLGTLPDDLQKLILASMALKLQALTAAKDHTIACLMDAHLETECATHHRKIYELEAQANLLMDLMWQETRQIFAKSDPGLDLGIRANFQVVEFRDDEPTPSRPKTMIVTFG